MIQTSKTTPTSGAKENQNNLPHQPSLKPSIVFFGSGPVAAASLELLADSFTIEAVVTKPRPPHHHGTVPVIEIGQKLGLRLIEVSNKKDLSEKIAAETFTSSVGVLIDFGIIVARDVIDTFPLGIINSHFSLLPDLRGADPITFAILRGQKRTGVSLMSLVEAMDEGPLLSFGVQELDDTYTTPRLTDRLIHLSYALLKHDLPPYIEKNQKTMLQQSEIAKIITDFDYPAKPSYTRKLTKADGRIDLTKSAIQLEREVRAFLGWPGSYTVIAEKNVTITSAHALQNMLDIGNNKTILVYNKQLCLQTAQGILVIDSLKPAGKSEMSASAFLTGYGKNL